MRAAAFFLVCSSSLAAAGQQPLILSPLTTNAIKITGNVRISDTRIEFESGSVLDVTKIEESASGATYRAEGQKDPEVLFGNTLCGAPPVLLRTVIQDKDYIVLEVYAKGDPADGGVEYCAGYGYATADDQKTWPVTSAYASPDFGEAMIDTFCEEQALMDNDFDGCVAAQDRAWDTLAAINDDDRVATCHSYATAGRPVGSMEYIDKIPVAACVLDYKAAQSAFSDCVRKVIGVPFDGTMAWDYGAAEHVALCYQKRMKASAG